MQVVKGRLSATRITYVLHDAMRRSQNRSNVRMEFLNDCYKS